MCDSQVLPRRSHACFSSGTKGNRWHEHLDEECVLLARSSSQGLTPCGLQTCSWPRTEFSASSSSQRPTSGGFSDTSSRPRERRACFPSLLRVQALIFETAGTFRNRLPSSSVSVVAGSTVRLLIDERDPVADAGALQDRSRLESTPSRTLVVCTSRTTASLASSSSTSRPSTTPSSLS